MTALPEEVGALDLAFQVRIIHERDRYRQQARMWKAAYWTVVAQFFVMTVIAVWGWTR